MQLLRRAALPLLVANGMLALAVRAFLITAAIGVLLLGYRLPSVATTQGEVAVGLLLSLCVTMQMLFAAVYFPMALRR